MGLSADGFTYLGSLEVPSLGGATASNVPTVVKNTDFTAAMLSSLESSGDDLRLSSDLAGDTQLPIDIVDGLNVLWTLVPSVAAAVKIYVWGNKPAAVKEIDTATYGRNAVWVGHGFRYGFTTSPASGLEDSTANANNGIIENGVGTGAGKISQAWSFDGVDTAVLVPTDASQGFGTSDFTIQAWIKPTAENASGGARIVSTSGKGSVTSKNGFQVKIQAYDTGWKVYDCSVSDGVNGIASGDTSSTTAHPFNVWAMVTMVYDYSEGRITMYVNATEDSNVVGTPSNSNSTNDLHIGASRYNSNVLEDASQVFEGLIDSVSARTGGSSPARIDIEKQNQSATGAWWIAEDAISGGFNPIWASFSNQLIQ